MGRAPQRDGATHMSGVRPERAPLFTRAYSVCRMLDERRRDDLERELRPLREQAHELLFAIAEALSFTARRREDLARADRFALRLRLALRLSAEVRVLSLGFVRSVQAELVQIGAMLGGWQRSLVHDAEQRRLEEHRGARSRAAATASSAAAPTGTKRGGVAPRTATGTRRTTPGTITASGSSCPPPNPREELELPDCSP